MDDFPLAVERHGDRYMVHPVGEHPSSGLITWLAQRQDAPPGFRVVRGTVPIADLPRVDLSLVDLPHVERPITVDQTNRSVVVAERAVVKWTTGPLRGQHPASERLRRLIAAGFDAMPPIWAMVEWQTPDGHWVPVAVTTSLIPHATDGWTWCLAEAAACTRVDAVAASAGPAPGPGPERSCSFAVDLGSLTARMHLALADTPTGPVATHGDFHIGQILRDASGRMYVIDFDGNPTVSAEDRIAHRPAAYDVAGMLMSLENVGHVLRRHHPEISEQAVIGWTESVSTEFLAAYRSIAGDLLDEALLEPFVIDQIQRELAYAEAHLPGWRYVPEAALRRRGRQ
ncbi:MAG: hypothetical protein BGO26_12990 [Actinobacteria bacterium 69-20]|jgi:maltokinase|nr:phosphotransferase [Actinomycetota bacterium]OJV23597.1 MAG: hypothetical protein BGO26_12990 [Actinobacteria bacterium 69-20]